MVIPFGIEQGHIWCILWLSIVALLLQLVKEPSADDTVAADVRKRTYRRLLKLNQYLYGLVEQRWMTEDLVPDVEALMALRAEVDLAAAVHTANQDRRRAIRICRVLLGLEILGALLFALLVSIWADDSQLNLVASLTFGGGTLVAMACLVLAELKASEIESGEDFGGG